MNPSGSWRRLTYTKKPHASATCAKGASLTILGSESPRANVTATMRNGSNRRYGTPANNATKWGVVRVGNLIGGNNKKPTIGIAGRAIARSARALVVIIS